MSPVVLPALVAGSSAAPEGLRANWRPWLVALTVTVGAAGLAADPVVCSSVAAAGTCAVSLAALGGSWACVEVEGIEVEAVEASASAS